MHSALFVAKLGTRGIRDQASQNFLGQANAKVRPSQYVVRFSENVWLINAAKDPASLGHLISYADTSGVSYGILQLDEAPQWMPESYNPHPE
jgi:hypothetical protein